MGWPLETVQTWSLSLWRWDLESLQVLWMGGVGRTHGWMEGFGGAGPLLCCMGPWLCKLEFKFLAPTGPSFLGW